MPMHPVVRHRLGPHGIHFEARRPAPAGLRALHAARARRAQAQRQCQCDEGAANPDLARPDHSAHGASNGSRRLRGTRNSASIHGSYASPAAHGRRHPAGGSPVPSLPRALAPARRHARGRARRAILLARRGPACLVLGAGAVAPTKSPTKSRSRRSSSPRGGRLTFLVRAPLKAMRDIDVPTRDNGLPRPGPGPSRLETPPRSGSGDFVELFENGQPLASRGSPPPASRCPRTSRSPATRRRRPAWPARRCRRHRPLLAGRAARRGLRLRHPVRPVALRHPARAHPPRAAGQRRDAAHHAGQRRARLRRPRRPRHRRARPALAPGGAARSPRTASSTSSTASTTCCSCSAWSSRSAGCGRWRRGHRLHRRPLDHAHRLGVRHGALRPCGFRR